MLRRARAFSALALLVGVSCTPQTTSVRLTPRSGGTLNVALRELGSLDPAQAATRGALSVVAQIFDPLTSIDPDSGKVIAGAAASWAVSKDGKRWRFHLKEAVYTDGSAVTAMDFKFAFDRIARRSTHADAAFQLQPVAGFRAAHTTGASRTLTGVRVLSKHVLEITTEHPFAELPTFLAHPALAPLAPRYRTSFKGLSTAPVGNGPFRVKAATLERSATIERNPTYGGSPPYLDAIAFRVIHKIDAGWRAYLDGDVQVADVPPSAVESRREVVGDGGFTPFWATLSFGPNLRLAKYNKPEVRRALSLALDRNAIASSVYGNTKDAATGLLPRGVRGYLPDACSVCTLERDRARQILHAAFGANPPAIAIDHLVDPTSTKLAKAVASDLRQVGLRPTLRSYSNAAYLKLLQSGKQDFAQLGWLAVVPTPDGFLAEQLRTGAQNNTTGFKDARFDASIDRARREGDESTRLRFYHAAENRALDLMPIIPVVFFRNRTAVAARVQGFVLDGAGVFDGTRVWLR